MAVREDIINYVTSLFTPVRRAPYTYDPTEDDAKLPIYGILDDGSEEAERVYSSHRVTMPITIEAIDFFQDAGASSDPVVRDKARAVRANALLETIKTTMIAGEDSMPDGFDALAYTGGQPVYPDSEQSQVVGAAATFSIVYIDDFS